MVKSALWHARAVGKDFSASQLTVCPRQIRLKRQVDWWVEPKQMYWAFRGQMMHGIGQHYANEYDFGVIVERRIKENVNGRTLSGQVDLFYPDRGHLIDYKSTIRLPGPWKVYYCGSCGKVLKESPWAIRKNTRSFQCPHCHYGNLYRERQENLVLLPPRTRGHHDKQINIYAWLLSRKGYTVRTAEIVYMAPDDMLRIPVPLWGEDEVRPYIEHRLACLYTEAAPSGVADNPEENWQCRYCEVADNC